MAGRSCILTYHSLDDSGSVISTPPALFRQQMEFLAASRVPVVPLNEVLARPGSVAITFDDGFCNVAEQGLAILHRLGLPATIFVVSSYCGGRNNWPTQPAGTVPILPLMTWQELSRLPSSISVGAHTATHPFLSRLPVETCENEMVSCKDEIEQRLGNSVLALAYPYGDLSPRVHGMAARHFDLAVGTSLNFVQARPDPLDLPRIDTYYLRERFSLDRLFQPTGSLYIGVRRLLRGVRRITGSAPPSIFPARRS